MKLVYIAGPYRAPTPWGVEQNIQAAVLAAAQVWAAGLAAVCPHANSAHMEGVTTDENFLAGTLEMLRRCDAILVIEGWKNSEGARGEVDEAVRLGLPVLYKWGDKSYLADTLRRLAATPDGYRSRADDPRKGQFWMSVVGPCGLTDDQVPPNHPPVALADGAHVTSKDGRLACANCKTSEDLFDTKHAVAFARCHKPCKPGDSPERAQRAMYKPCGAKHPQRRPPAGPQR